VGSLLEVGTGFHPELTGRENITLNGAILGMKRAEIERKFDEIVAFAEIEKFMDTPVKHYSSGMYVRLAFAVAAHLEPEILVVDEVLAVGDAAFQKKCLGKMGDVAREGRTVLFVSHNMGVITRICESGILLNGGNLVKTGFVTEVVSSYLNFGLGTMCRKDWLDRNKAPGDDVVRIKSIHVENECGVVADVFDITQLVRIVVEYWVLRPGVKLVPNLHFFTQEGVRAFASLDSDSNWRGRVRPVGTFTSTAIIPGNLLAEGIISIAVAISTLHPHITHVYVNDAVAFQVVDRSDGTSARGEYAGPMPGVLSPLLIWTTAFTSDEVT
jgi:lipopolysaccharide transport system ATP-binding protein